MRTPRLPIRLPWQQEEAAREALALCRNADRMAADAMQCVGTDDQRLFELLEKREEVLQTLAEHIVSLRLERPAADSTIFAATERAADEADELVTQVCSAVDQSQRTTMALAARVAARVTELRAELAEVQRAGTAHGAYAPSRLTGVIDSRR